MTVYSCTMAAHRTILITRSESHPTQLVPGSSLPVPPPAQPRPGHHWAARARTAVDDGDRDGDRLVLGELPPASYSYDAGEIVE